MILNSSPTLYDIIEKTIFKTLLVAISSESLDLSQHYYRGMQSLVGFSVIPNCITRFSLR